MNPKKNKATITVKEVAKMADMRPEAIRQAVKNGTFPVKAAEVGEDSTHRKKGKKLLFSRAEVEKWLGG